MVRHLRFSLANALLAVTCVALAIGWWATWYWSHAPAIDVRRRPPSGDISTLPITISASEVGRFSKGNSWYLSVNSAGQADLTIDNRRRGRLQRFQISEDQMNDLRRLLGFHDDFFLLDDDYGTIVPDGSTRMLTISVGNWTKTVRLHFLKKMASAKNADLDGARKALIIWERIRGWFHYPEAVDTRGTDKQLLNAKAGSNER